MPDTRTDLPQVERHRAGRPRSLRTASVTGGLASRRDIPVSPPDPDSRSEERSDTRDKNRSGLTVVRAIGCFAADDPPRLKSPKHLLHERLPTVDTGQPDHRGVDDRMIDMSGPVGAGAAATERIPAKVHAESKWPGRMAQPRSDRQKGFLVVAAVVAASAGVTTGLVWGLHLAAHSPHAVQIAPVDGSRATPRINGFAPPTTHGLDSAGYPDATVDPDPATTAEPDLHDSDDPALDDPNADATLRAGQNSSPLNDPSESIGVARANGGLRSGTPSDGPDTGAPEVGPGLDHSDGGTPSTGSQSLRQSRSGSYPNYGRYPDPGSDYPRDPDRSRRTLPRVDQDAMPGLGGL